MPGGRGRGEPLRQAGAADNHRRHHRSCGSLPRVAADRRGGLRDRRGADSGEGCDSLHHIEVPGPVRAVPLARCYGPGRLGVVGPGEDFLDAFVGEFLDDRF